MSCFRLMVDNYLDSAFYASKDESSEQTTFPATNVEAKKRRARVWRSNGYFEVTSSNNTIIFEETASTNLTATISVGTYTSVTSFLSAVESALESAGGSDYTCTQDSTTLKIKISSDGAGGGGILNLEWDNASTTAEDLLGFDNGATDTGALTYTADFLRVNSEEFITYDFGLPSTFEAFILGGKRNTAIQLGQSGTYKLEANPTDSWSSPAFTTTLSYDSENFQTIAAAGSDLTSGTQYRFWRLSLDDKDNPNGYLEISSMFLGNSFGESTTGRVQFPLQSLLIDRSRTVTSEGGQTFSDVKQKTQQFSVKWFNLKKAEVEEIESIFDEFGTSSPFWVSMDTDAVYSTSANRRIIYCKFAQQPQWTLDRADIFSVTATFLEEV